MQKIPTQKTFLQFEQTEQNHSLCFSIIGVAAKSNMVHRHIVLISFPAQGAINPLIQFAKNLKRMGVNKVSILSSVSAQRRMTKASPTDPTPQGLTFVAFSDGYDDGVKLSDNQDHYRSELKNRGSKALLELITASSEEGNPVTGLVYAMLLPWAAEVARAFNIPFAPLWIQPATIFDIYYYYFNGYGDSIRKIAGGDPSCTIELPGLPKLTSRDLPTFMLPSNKYSFGLPGFKEQLDALDAEANPTVLVNTFDALEAEALRAIGKHNLVAIGPLVPSAFLDGKDPSDIAFGGDLLPKSRDYVEWLDSKPQSSVVYISFGSFFMLAKQQMEEIARGLLESHRPFLWVIRASPSGEKPEDVLSCKEELEKQGMIVPWCSQVEVLSHPSVGCFVSHCGWSSSLESLVLGVPVVGLPQFTDQPTNAKILEDSSKTGVRARMNEEGIAEADEIKRCIELVTGDGETGEEMRRNAKKWKDLAKEAAKEGGSSYMNLRAFVDEMEGGFK